MWSGTFFESTHKLKPYTDEKPDMISIWTNHRCITLSVYNG